MLSQEIWVSLRLCISKKFQVIQVLLALTPPSESQGMKKPAGQVGQLVCKEGLLRKYYVKNRENVGQQYFAHYSKV